MSKVSVIVPVYNTAEYLEKCLDSLINQTLEDIEIICINDGSTDNSLDILQTYAQKDNRIKIIDKQNEGVAAARNVAIQQASGEFLGFVDSDDWVDLDYYEKLYNAAKNNNCDIACAGFIKVSSEGKNLSKKVFKQEKIYSDINSKLEADHVPADNYIWNKIYNREAWLKTGILFPQGRVFEDIAILIKIMYRLGNMVTVPNINYYYRRTPNSTIENESPKYTEDYEWAVNEQKTFAKKHGIVLPAGKTVRHKVIIKFLKWTIFSIVYYDRLTKYKLFGSLTIFRKIEE